MKNEEIDINSTPLPFLTCDRMIRKKLVFMKFKHARGLFLFLSTHCTCQGNEIIEPFYCINVSSLYTIMSLRGRDLKKISRKHNDNQVLISLMFNNNLMVLRTLNSGTEV